MVYFIMFCKRCQQLRHNSYKKRILHIFPSRLQNRRKKTHFDEFVQWKMNIFIDFYVKMWYI